MEHSRDGLAFTSLAPDDATADQFEILLALWQPTPAIDDQGDRTVYNAQRNALRERRDAAQDAINAIDTATEPDARAKIDAAIRERDYYNDLMRRTARTE